MVLVPVSAHNCEIIGALHGTRVGGSWTLTYKGYDSRIGPISMMNYNVVWLQVHAAELSVVIIMLFGCRSVLQSLVL